MRLETDPTLQPPTGLGVVQHKDRRGSSVLARIDSAGICISIATGLSFPINSSQQNYLKISESTNRNTGEKDFSKRFFSALPRRHESSITTCLRG